MPLNLKLLSRVVKTQDVTKDQAPVTVNPQLPVAPAPVAFGMAADLIPVAPFAVSSIPAPVVTS